MRSKPIYVEIVIRSSMDELWRFTQVPELHERWDLRFTSIEYLPRPDPQQPQRFLYTTRIGLGMKIEGEGESVGSYDGPAGRVSSLKFWSNDPKSLIRDGSGYWKYVPLDGSIRFFTRYDYETRFGWVGQVFDRFIFRPLLGWATAWSFDRLRLWIERGIDPSISMQRSVMHAMVRITLSLIWLYQGIVPKLLFRSISGELETVRQAGLFDGYEKQVLTTAAAIEIVIGIALLVLWRSRWVFPVIAVILLLLGVAPAVSNPKLFIEQFNPATLNIAMIALAAIGWIAQRDLPSARSCLRREAGLS